MNDPASPSSPDGEVSSSSDVPTAPPNGFGSTTATSVRSQPTEQRLGPDSGLVLAALWLVCSIAFGLWLMISSHSIASRDVGVGHIATTRSQAYGGDAYTGMQNAAANTANAVRTLAVFDGTNARIERRVSSRADIGIGFIVISIGVVNFNMALKRRVPLPR
jgi:hypothetical protein